MRKKHKENGYQIVEIDSFGRPIRYIGNPYHSLDRAKEAQREIQASTKILQYREI